MVKACILIAKRRRINFLSKMFLIYWLNFCYKEKKLPADMSVESSYRSFSLWETGVL